MKILENFVDLTFSALDLVKFDSKSKNKNAKINPEGNEVSVSFPDYSPLFGLCMVNLCIKKDEYNVHKFQFNFQYDDWEIRHFIDLGAVVALATPEFYSCLLKRRKGRKGRIRK